MIRKIIIVICLVMALSLIGCRSNTVSENADSKAKQINITVSENVSKVSWDEITEDGIDEEKLIENIDAEILNTIGKELQLLVDEEAEAERANPEIVITEGWTRVFKSERYKKILELGQSAMKPLYLIIYKSENAGEYEYICASALIY